MLAKNASKVGPRYPQVVVLVGATGDLSRRRLLPGLFHLCSSGFIPGCRIIGVSLDELDPDGFRKIAREALGQFSSRKVNEADWAAFAATLNYVPMSAGPGPLREAVEAARRRPAGGAAAGRSRSRRAQPRHHGKALRHRPGQRRVAERQAA